MDRFVRVAGKTSVEEVALAEPVTIGRGEENALRVFDETASRRHAVVRVEGGRIVVVDLGSSNGTRVNGERGPPAFLSRGDLVGIRGAFLRLLRAPSPHQ